MGHESAQVTTQTAEEFWEEFYGAEDRIWSGQPNPLLVRGAASLEPTTALDLGCGEGADAVWLAEQGWRVTAVDISATALRRGAEHASAAGVGAAIRWERHDLAQTFPEGTFGLVSAQFFHSPVAVDEERESALRRAVEAVAPGGVLLVGGHAGVPSWAQEHHDVRFPTTAEVRSSLGLDPEHWEVELDEVVERDMPSPDGRPGVRTDNVLRVRRLG